MVRLLFFLSFFLLSAIQSVAGHGFVHEVNIEGKDFPGWNPFDDPYQNPVPERVIRKIQDDGPVPGSSNDMNCGIGGDSGTPAVADIAAGSAVTFKWEYWPADHQGPVSTYMASCDNDCTNFSASNTRWFKVDAEGYDPDTKQWAADQLRANHYTWISKVPAELKAGQYLIRHEIVALHSQMPQFYPSCTQVRVTGSGTGTPSDSDLATIQDIYRDATWPFIYGDFGTFTIPGPPPVTLGDNPGTGSGGITPRHSASKSSPVSAPTGSTVSGGQSSSSTSVSGLTETGHCRLKSRSLAKNRLVKRNY